MAAIATRTNEAEYNTTTASAFPARRESVRFSTYSGAPSLHPSIAMSTCTSAAGESMAPKKNSVYQTFDSEKMAYNPAMAASTSTLNSMDPRHQDIRSWSAGFERMQDQRLEAQRYVMSEKKGDEVSTTALGAKVERALGRRMVGQDAIFTPRRQSKPVELPAAEKRSLEVQAAS